MKENESTIKVIVAFVILVIAIILVIVVRVEKDKKQSEKAYINTNVVELKDDNRFLTITTAIDSFVSNIKHKQSENLMDILDKKYAAQNNINSSNILDKIDVYETTYNVSIREIYQVKSYNNIFIYYVKAKLYETNLISTEHRHIRNVFYKVTINENDVTFAVAPIEENEYMSKVGETDDR